MALPDSLEIGGNGMILEVGSDVCNPHPPVHGRKTVADVGEEGNVSSGP